VSLTLTGRAYTIRGTGFLAGENVRAILHSDPLDLGVRQADATGVVTFTGTLPTDFPAGQHTVELIGERTGQVTQGFKIDSSGTLVAAGATATRTLTSVALGLLAFGLLATGLGLVARNRRQAIQV
jgi:hypothetical protein